ncbi:hypothetical protein AOLI_G00177870 [Acnodon oligacanthus]
MIELCCIKMLGYSAESFSVTQARAVELSVQAGVSSSHPAFIAVLKGSGEAVKGPLLRRRVPTAEEDSVGPVEAVKDPLLQLISLQKASGCWEMDGALAEVFGKTEEEVVKQTPAQVEKGVWATVLALIWLHGFKMDAQVEWRFVALKAVMWIRNQKGKHPILSRNH